MHYALSKISILATILSPPFLFSSPPSPVPVDWLSSGGDVLDYANDINQSSLPTPFLFCSCVYFSLYGRFNCISFHQFSRQLSAFRSVLSVLILPYWSCQLAIFLVSLSPNIIRCGWLGLTHQLTKSPPSPTPVCCLSSHYAVHT